MTGPEKSIATDSTDRYELHTYFQFAPRAHAQIKPGQNDFELFLESADETPLANWSGMQVEFVWDEVR